MLRPYQRECVDALYAWVSEHKGNPCVVMPTGSGKSHVIAAVISEAIAAEPGMRILLATHAKELIDQDEAKLLAAWPEGRVSVGVVSAALGRKEYGRQVTVAGVQSVVRSLDRLGFIDLMIVDEAHLISHREEGSYRKIINKLKWTNPRLRVVGFTATPYRLGIGSLTSGPTAMFQGLVNTDGASIASLVSEGFLAPLRSKQSDFRLDTAKVGVRGGEYVASLLQSAVDTDRANKSAVRELIERARAADRRTWLIFCAGVDHAQHVSALLSAAGVVAACVTGETAPDERERIISGLRSGAITAVANANVLTTGVDIPGIDLIAMLRPTMSLSLYVQMLGRGMRPKTHTDHCLVLDFAGNIARHGPLLHIEPEERASAAGKGDAPIKPCPVCHELVHLSVMTCPDCGHEFARREKVVKLDVESDVMGDMVAALGPDWLPVTGWTWSAAYSYKGPRMLVCEWHTAKRRIKESYCIGHPGVASELSRRRLQKLLPNRDVRHISIDDALASLRHSAAPAAARFKQSGKYHNLQAIIWRN